MQVTMEELIAAWNAIPGFSRCLHFGASRRKQFGQRAKERFFRENWRLALEEAQKRPFCFGENDRGWKATIDWFMRPETVGKLLEGDYLKTPQKRPNLTEARRDTYQREWAERRAEYAQADPQGAAEVLRKARMEGRA